MAKSPALEPDLVWHTAHHGPADWCNEPSHALTIDVPLMQRWAVPAFLLCSSLAACMREPEIIEPGERLPSDVEQPPRPMEWLNVPIPEGEESCELRQIERMLNANCGECHRELQFRVPIDCIGNCGFTPIRVDDLIELGKITPGSAETSRVMIRIEAGEMPPPQVGLSMSEADAAWLASFIDTLEPGVAPTCPPAP
jgi:hypothetical protein